MKQIKRFKNESKPVIELYEDNMFRDCWLSDWKYLMVEGKSIHKEWARGEGEVVRHLCGDNRCINPIHLLRGSDIENAMDEIEVQDFTTRKFSSIMNDTETIKLRRDIAYLTIIPRYCTWYNSNMKRKFEKYMQMSDAIKLGREYFRSEFVRNLTCTDKDIDLADKLLKYLNSRFFEVKLYITKYR